MVVNVESSSELLVFNSIPLGDQSEAKNALLGKFHMMSADTVPELNTNKRFIYFLC